MAIYKGSTEITDLKLGGTQVQSVYQGSNLVWSSYVDPWTDSVFIDGAPTVLLRASQWATDIPRTVPGRILMVDTNGVTYRSDDGGATFDTRGTLSNNTVPVMLNGSGMAAYQGNPSDSTPSTWMTAHETTTGNYTNDRGTNWFVNSTIYNQLAVCGTNYRTMRLTEAAPGARNLYSTTSGVSQGAAIWNANPCDAEILVRSGDYYGVWALGGTFARFTYQNGTISSKNSPGLATRIRSGACSYNADNLSVAVGGSASDIRASTDGGVTWFTNNPPTTQDPGTVDAMGWGNGVYRISLQKGREIWENDLSSASSPWTLVSSGGDRIRSIEGTLDRFLIHGASGRCQYQLYADM